MGELHGHGTVVNQELSNDRAGLVAKRNVDLRQVEDQLFRLQLFHCLREEELQVWVRFVALRYVLKHDLNVR
jgi:hypothetical protein